MVETGAEYKVERRGGQQGGPRAQEKNESGARRGKESWVGGGQGAPLPYRASTAYCQANIACALANPHTSPHMCECIDHALTR